MSTPTTPAGQGTPAKVTAKRTLEQIDAEWNTVAAQLPTAPEAQRFILSQKLMALAREKATITAEPRLVEYLEQKKKLTELSNTVNSMAQELLAGGVPAEKLGLERGGRRRATGEGQAVSAVGYTEKYPVYPEGRLIAFLIKEAGASGVEESALSAHLAPKKPIEDSGSAQAVLRGLRDVYHVISFEGSPGGATEEGKARIYLWSASAEQLATYNAALKKAGREELV